jgi:hypothetical protein
MVHALKEANRVLSHAGTLLDARPLSLNVPLEIEYDGAVDSAGIVDLSSERSYDLSADKAIEGVVLEGIFSELKLRFFDFIYYWNSVKDMQKDLEEFWGEWVIISKDSWEKAKKLLKKKQPGSRIRVRLLMKLGEYRKE